MTEKPPDHVELAGLGASHGSVASKAEESLKLIPGVEEKSEVDRAPAYSSSSCCCVRIWKKRRISLFWVEKFWLLIRLFQVLGLIWAFARAWPLPFALRNDTRWIVLFNADLVSYYTYIEDNDVLPTFRGSVFGVYPNYWILAAAWAGGPIVLALLAFAVVRYARRAFLLDTRGAENFLFDLGLNLALLIHLPLVLNLSHAYVCSSHPVYTDGLRLSVDPQWPCFSWQHLALMGGCAPTMIFFLVLFPLWLWRHVNRRLVFSSRQKFHHERHLRWKEAEYLFSLSSEWRRDRMWLFSSFRRPWWHPYDRFVWLVSVEGLVAAYSYLRFSSPAQTDVLFGVLALWSLWHLISKAYRCGTSHLLAAVVYVGLSMLTFWGVMRAHGLKSSLVVDTAWSAAVEGIALAAIACAGFAGLIIPLYPGFGWPRGIISAGGDLTATTKILMGKPDDDAAAGEESQSGGQEGENLQLLPGFLTAAELRSARLRTTLRAISTKVFGANGGDNTKKKAGLHRDEKKHDTKNAKGGAAAAAAAGRSLLFERKTASITPAGGNNSSLAPPLPPRSASSDGDSGRSDGHTNVSSQGAFSLASPSFARGAARVHPVPPLMAFARATANGNANSREGTSSSLEPPQTSSSRREDRGNGIASNNDGNDEEEKEEDDDLLDALLAAREAEYDQNEERQAAEKRVDTLIQSRKTTSAMGSTANRGGLGGGEAAADEDAGDPSSSSSSSSSAGLASTSATGLRDRSAPNALGATATAIKKKGRGDGGVNKEDDNDHLALAIRSISTHRHRARADSTHSAGAAGSALSFGIGGGGGGAAGDHDSGGAASPPVVVSSFDRGHILTANSDPLSIAEVAALETIWVSLIKAARACIHRAKMTPSEIVDVPLLRAHARTLKREWKRAALCGHILSWSLEEATDDCMRVADEAIKRSTVITTITRVKYAPQTNATTKQKGPNQAGEDGGRIISKEVRRDVKQASVGVLGGISHAFSVLAHGPLETVEKAACFSVFPNCCGFGRDTLRSLKERMDAHDAHFILANPKRARIAFKLFVLAALMGPKHASSVKRLRIKGVNDSFFIDPALLAAALQRAQATKTSVDLVKLADECERLMGGGSANSGGGGGGTYAASFGLAAVSALAGLSLGSPATLMASPNNAMALSPMQMAFTPFSPNPTATATATATVSVAANAAAAIAVAGAGAKQIAAGADAEAEEDRLLEEGYSSIASAYKDVDPDVEIPILLSTASTLGEVIDVVVPGRMRAEVKHWLARMRRIAAATATAASAAALPHTSSFFGASPAANRKQQQETALSIVKRGDAILLAQEREPPEFNDVPGDAAIGLETKKILFSVYCRVGEVVGKEKEKTTLQLSSSLPALLRMRAKAAGWILQLYPREAACAVAAKAHDDDSSFPPYFALAEPITQQSIRRLLSEAESAEHKLQVLQQQQQQEQEAVASSTSSASNAGLTLRPVVASAGSGGAATAITGGGWRVSTATDLSSSQTAAAASRWNKQQQQLQQGTR